jgi:hypothetical protein
MPPQRLVKRREADTRAKDREKEKLIEQELQEQDEKFRERISAEKEKLSPKARTELRQKALGEINSIEGIKEEFITDILIEAKENEILKTKMENE